MFSSKNIYIFFLIKVILSQDFDISDTADPSSIIYEQDKFQNLKKYGKVRVSPDIFILFESKDFNNNEKINFRIKALNTPGNFYKEKVSYKYINSLDDFSESNMIDVSLSSTSHIQSSYGGVLKKVRYFSITKKEKEFEDTNGDLLIIVFYIKEGVVEISNIDEIEESGNKLEGWAIGLIVASAAVIASVVGIILYLNLRKNKLNMKNEIDKEKESEKDNADPNVFPQDIQILNINKKYKGNERNKIKYNFNEYNNNESKSISSSVLKLKENKNVNDNLPLSTGIKNKYKQKNEV